MSVYHFYPTRNQSRYIQCDSTITAIMSPMGEGKTLASIARVFRIASSMKDSLNPGEMFGVIIVRDTHENNKHSVVKTFTQEWFTRYPIPHRWRGDYRELIIESDPPIHIDLFGIDDTAALTKLQGAVGVGLIWLEEVAPYTESFRTNAGISEDVFNSALVRCARQSGLPPKLQMSFNPPDEDHWVYRRVLSVPDGQFSPKTPLITKTTIEIPRGENKHLSDAARQAVQAAYEHDEAAYARFVLGETATKYPGKRVAVNFNADWHVSKTPLAPIQGLDGWISFDSWGNPAAVMGQQTPNGRLLVLQSFQGGEDIRSLIRDYIFPTLRHPRWMDKCRSWRIMGDCTMINMDQSNVAVSAARIVEAAFSVIDDTDSFDEAMEKLFLIGGEGPSFEPGPTTWRHIRDGLLFALKWTIGGEPAVLIDNEYNKPLISALKGRYHYGKNKAGVVNYSGPVKDEASHLGDAFANAMWVMSPWKAPISSRRSQAVAQARSQSLARAQSYATG